MALIELHYNGVFLAKVATASVGHEGGTRAFFLIAGPAPELDLPEQYTLVIDGQPYPLKHLKLAADGKTVSAELE